MFNYIRLKNFLSFGDVTFDFTKNSKETKQIVAIYGENGSGKSNFVRCFDLLCNTITSLDFVNGVKNTIEKIQTDSDSVSSEKIKKILSSMDIQKQLSSCRMIDCKEPTEIEYGFKLNDYDGIYKLTFSDRIESESLYYFTGKQRGYFFNIKSDKNDSILKSFWSGLFLNSNSKNEYEEYINKYWGKHTFLSIVFETINGQNLNYILKNISKHLLEVIDSFLNSTVITKKSGNYGIRFFAKSNDLLLENLRSGSIDKKQSKQLEKSERIIKDFLTQTYSDIKDVSYEKKYVDNKIEYQLYVDKMIAGKIRHISFEDESSGTQQVLKIVNVLLGLFSGVTVVYDEIDNGIHDILLNEIVDSLGDEITGQLIITTHNTLLLETLDKHSAYVICVDYLGNKTIKCIDEFNIQNNNNIRVKYLKGLFGGTPFIDGIDYDLIIDELSDEEEE